MAVVAGPHQPPTERVQPATTSEQDSVGRTAATSVAAAVSVADVSTATVAVTIAAVAAAPSAGAGDGPAIAARHGPRSPSPMSTPLVRFPVTAAKRPLPVALPVPELVLSPAMAADGSITPGGTTPALQQSTSPFAPPAPATGAPAICVSLQP